MMAINLLFPVLFIMLLGWLSCRFRWLTADHCTGAKRLVFDILFPIFIYTLLVESNLKPHFLTQIVFLVVVWTAVYFLGCVVFRSSKSRFAHIMPFLLLTCEGGSVALPLYMSMVAPEHIVNIITFDIAGILINFGLLPAIVAKRTAGRVDYLPLFRRIMTSPFIIAVVLGIISNVSGLHWWAMTTVWKTYFNGISSMISAPISTVILFTLGYEFRLNSRMIGDILRLTVMRLLVCGGIIMLFFQLFPQQMHESFFLIAVLLYFVCPPGFPVPFQIEALCKGEDDEHFLSAFISLFILIALAGYSLIMIYLGLKNGLRMI